MSEDWFILRTSGRFTLQLAASLAEDGFDVWTPARTQTIRIPRKNVRREIRLPMLPSFIFARSQHLIDLLELAKQPSVKHRPFSLFRYHDSIPTIHDKHLEPLRAAERKAVPKKDRPRFDRGQGVRVNTGAFEGLRGKVQKCQSGYALVIFDDYRRPVKIPTFLLEENEANSAATGQLRAKAA